MLNLKSRLQDVTAHAVKAIYGLAIDPASLVVNTTQKPHTGDYTVVLFPLTKHKIGKPEEIGDALGRRLQELHPELVWHYEVVKGFLNLTLSPTYWNGFLASAHQMGDAFFQKSAGEGRRVMVEYCSPNTNKPLHLGHLRNNFLGYSIANLLKATGSTVTKANLVNDRGIHICKSMLAYQRFGNGETPESSGIKGDHLVGKYYVVFSQKLKEESEPILAQLLAEGMEAEKAKLEAEKRTELMQATTAMLQAWEANDPQVRALWEMMNGWVFKGFNETFVKTGIDFDKYYYESQTYLLGKDIVDEGIAKGVFYRKEDGSAWVDLTEYGLDHKLILRSDGTSVYITQDLATAQLKFDEFQLDESLYVIGNEQDYHMKVLQSAMHKLGRPWAMGIRHISYGMVELTTGKMKSREGTVVDADDLVREMEQVAKEAAEEKGLIDGFTPEDLAHLHETIALGSLKFFLLKVDPVKRMIFEPKESISFEGQTGVYIQFNHARMCALLRKAADQGHTPEMPDAIPELLPTEVALLTYVQNYEEMLLGAARAYDPALVAKYVYDLAHDFARFYAEVPVLKEPDIARLRFRLVLVEQVRRTVNECLRLLGIRAPERM